MQHLQFSRRRIQIIYIDKFAAVHYDCEIKNLESITIS